LCLLLLPLLNVAQQAAWCWPLHVRLLLLPLL
jgi:hypothetical protein